VYWASPFRAVDRDFEASCYQAAAVLRNAAPGGTLVSIGDGPYPEHGVGFEVGSYAAYMAGWRLVGGNAELPPPAAANALVSRTLAVKADAVAVWGSPVDPAYVQIVEKIRLAPELLSASTFADPYKGEVGTIFLFRPGNLTRKRALPGLAGPLGTASWKSESLGQSESMSVIAILQQLFR